MAAGGAEERPKLVDRYVFGGTAIHHVPGAVGGDVEHGVAEIDGGVFAIALRPRLRKIPVQQPHVAGFVMHAAALQFGQLLREIADHFGCRHGPQPVQVESAPGRLDAEQQLRELLKIRLRQRQRPVARTGQKPFPPPPRPACGIMPRA